MTFNENIFPAEFKIDRYLAETFVPETTQSKKSCKSFKDLKTVCEQRKMEQEDLVRRRNKSTCL